MYEKLKKHTEEQLQLIFNDRGIEEKFHMEIIEYYNSCYAELFEDYKDLEDKDWGNEEPLKESSLNLTLDFVDKFLEQITEGHGEDWSRLFANSLEEGEMRIQDTYHELKKKDKKLARKEIEIIAEKLSDSPLAKKYYLYLFEIGEGGLDSHKKAKTYSSIYKKQIEIGKSKVFAHEYADLIAEGKHQEIYCYDYAVAYEKAILDNKDKDYAEVYAEKYASELVNIKLRAGISEDEEMIEFAIEKVNAYINAWEYLRSNKVEDRKTFMSAYESIHLNTYFSDGGIPVDKPNDDLDEEILQKTLIKLGIKEK